ncbi:threonine/serine dehydratase [Stieleria sp. TO1_6]|uniref:threonine ammonia-lyase n=1 Tax=Stieleria tagensis TaxID=2956795 RepID=UPI00209BA79A|nr:threonine/serine dehydratase [Stieleria tagensis]MCO8122247.1 threonine/serine dehydratase [Stieleria tagensis]
MSVPVIELDDVRSAADRIQQSVIRTPAIRCERLSKRLGCQIALKAENLQHVGAFKARGAANAVLSLNEHDASRGVVTHSSGNHAAALARAAARRGIPAHVVMPDNSSAVKIAAVQSYGVQPVFCQPNETSRTETAEALRRETGATFVHPYETPAVIAGQGTVGLELLQQIESIDAILVPVGGGGLLAGILVAVKSLRPDVKVFAVEPAWADDTARSLSIGSPQSPTRYDTVADGLRTGIGQNTFPVIQRWVDGLFLVSENAILSAMRRIAEDAHLVCEPSGAVALAGLIENADEFAGQTVGVVISGGNLDFADCKMGL